MIDTVKKIAVCLPSYNEASNIINITKRVDKALEKINKECKCYIVNTDNNSPDGTNSLFINTDTKNEKVSIVSNEVGKGINIINFMQFCEKNDIDYAFMFDSDLKSLKSNWIKKMLKKLGKSDFICPLYKRGRFEGNSTNHFVVPIIGVLYNKIIRQPIGGDYGFNKEYIKLFLNSFDNNEVIKQYGIDVYLVLLAITNGFKIEQVRLGKKIHGLSYNKMDRIFVDVAKSLTTCVNIMPKINNNNKKSNKWTYNSISKDKNCKFEDFVVRNENNNYEENKDIWIRQLIMYINSLNKGEEIDYQKMKEAFINYTFAYWTKYKRKHSYECERGIRNFYIELMERCEKDVYKSKV